MRWDICVDSGRALTMRGSPILFIFYILVALLLLAFMLWVAGHRG